MPKNTVPNNSAPKNKVKGKAKRRVPPSTASARSLKAAAKFPRKSAKNSARKSLTKSLHIGAQYYGHPQDESQEIVLAIRRGKIDALVIEGSSGEQVLTLQGTDHPYRVLVETINDGVATLDPSGTVLYANNRFGAILRVPSVNFIGTRLEKHVSPSDREMLRELIAQAATASTQGEITLNAAEGRARIIRLALTPIRESGNQNMCVVATELTELVEANEALRSNEESLQQLSARLLKLQDDERRRIARDLHDITGQKLAAQSIALSHLEVSKGLSATAQALVADCVAFNKQVGEEVRTLSYLLHPPLLDELGLASAVKWFTEGFEKRGGIQVELDIDTDFPRLPADVEVTLFRIIQESLTNVHRYSGSHKAAVRVRSTPQKTIEVEIRDSGKGISPEVLNALTGAIAPIGVGIQGMKERMRQMAGKLEITSRANEGTVVTATLPLPEPESVPSVESGDTSSGLVGSAVPRGGNSRRQILIADDHEMLRRGIRTILESQSEWEICGEAVNGQEAVELASTLRPDLVILDINMPVLNGLAAVRQILRSAPETKILVFTVHDSDQTAKEVQKAGAHGYLSKNNASADLLNLVKDLLRDTTSSSPSKAAAN